MTSPAKRRRRPFRPDELGLFLRELARTGNVTLSAAAIGRAVGCMRVRKRTDPTFARQWQQALALFQAGVAPDGYLVQRGGPNGRVQLRRAATGALRPADLARYFDTLALTGNLRLATAAVGRTRRAMLNRRERDPVFAEAEARALQAGLASLEADLVHSALAALGEHGEADWLDERAEFGTAGGEVPEPAFAMTADDAQLLLFRYWRRQERLAAAGSGRRPPTRPEPADEAAQVDQVVELMVEFARRELAEEEREGERSATAGAGQGGAPG